MAEFTAEERRAFSLLCYIVSAVFFSVYVGISSEDTTIIGALLDVVVTVCFFIDFGIVVTLLLSGIGGD